MISMSTATRNKAIALIESLTVSRSSTPLPLEQGRKRRYLAVNMRYDL